MNSMVLSSSRPRLNNLDGREWVKSTKSWFVVNPPSRTRDQTKHPAKFPEGLVARFVRYFTRQGGWVIDPFVGVGSTLVACKTLDRNSVGIELNPRYAFTTQSEVEKATGSGEHHIINGDSNRIASLLQQTFGGKAPQFDYLITSPPYWDMLHKSRGGNDSVHKERARKGLDQFYSTSTSDIGNIASYEDYIEAVGQVLDSVKPFLKEHAYITVVAQNMLDTDGNMRPIAWDLARRLSKTYRLRQEQIWCQDNKRLGCWGYPTTYVSNVHHHYCLILQNTLR
jgi:DNA modification methylase